MAAVIVGVLLIFMATEAVVVLRGAVADETAQARAAAERMIGIARPSLAAAVWRLARDDAAPIVESLAQSDEIASVALSTDIHRDWLTVTPPARTPTPLARWIARGIAPADLTVESAFPIDPAGEQGRDAPRGLLRLQLDGAEIAHRALGQLGQTVASALLRTVVVAIALVLMLRATVARPIAQLTEAIRRAPPGLDPPAELRSRSGVAELRVLTRRLAGLYLRAKRARDVLVQARDEAEAAQRIKDRFLAVVSHELRTPLNAIGGFAQLVQTAPEVQANPRLVENVAMIAAAGDQLSAQVERMLLFAQVETRGHRLTTQTVDLRSLAAGVRERLADRIASRRLTFEIVALRPQTTILSDPVAWLTIMDALIDNAVAFAARGGGVRVEILATPERARVTVEDDGPGIPEEVRAALGRAFLQRAAGAAEVSSGLGLGLGLTWRMCRAIGAELRLMAREPRGARVEVTLDLPRRPEPPAAA